MNSNINGIILLDMDGTTSNWVKSFLPLSGHTCIHEFNKHPDRSKILKEVYSNHPDLFLNLELMEPFLILKRYLDIAKDKFGFKIGILSSTGSEHFDSKLVEEHKELWLRNNSESLPVLESELIIFVDESDKKSFYASDNVILVDDWKRNCDEFVDGGGHAIHLGELGEYNPHEKGLELLELCIKVSQVDNVKC